MTGTPRPCYRSISIVADGRLEVCDGAHCAFVMKKVKGPALRFAVGRATRALPGLEWTTRQHSKLTMWKCLNQTLTPNRLPRVWEHRGRRVRFPLRMTA